MRPMKFAIFGNTYQAKKSTHVERLLSILDRHRAEVYICREFSMEMILKPIWC